MIAQTLESSIAPPQTLCGVAGRWATGVAPHAGDSERQANSGGPCSRSRSEHVTSTLLGRDEGTIRCPRVLCIGIDFGRRKPLACATTWLRACGFADEQQALCALALPVGPCLCQTDPTVRPTLASALSPPEGLRLALVLGLCTPWLYDPRRPVLWTTASLTRRLQLFDGKGFYA